MKITRVNGGGEIIKFKQGGIIYIFIYNCSSSITNPNILAFKINSSCSCFILSFLTLRT